MASRPLEAVGRPRSAPAKRRVFGPEAGARATTDHALAEAICTSAAVLGRETGTPKDVWRNKILEMPG